MEDSIHGTSYIFEITKKISKNSNVVEILLQEIESGLYDYLTYKNYPLKCLKYKNELHNKLIDYKLEVPAMAKKTLAETAKISIKLELENK